MKRKREWDSERGATVTGKWDETSRITSLVLILSLAVTRKKKTEKKRYDWKSVTHTHTYQMRCNVLTYEDKSACQ